MTVSFTSIFALRRPYRKFLLALFLAGTGALPAEAQTDLQTLFNERSELISTSSSTRDVDLQIFTLGARPAAVIRYETLENGTIRMDFPIYLTVTEERTERVIQRLTATYAYLLDMDFYLSEDKVVCLFTAGTTENQMEAITSHFGYAGYETAH